MTVVLCLKQTTNRWTIKRQSVSPPVKINRLLDKETNFVVGPYLCEEYGKSDLPDGKSSRIEILSYSACPTLSGASIFWLVAQPALDHYKRSRINLRGENEDGTHFESVMIFTHSMLKTYEIQRPRSQSHLRTPNTSPDARINNPPWS